MEEDTVEHFLTVWIPEYLPYLLSGAWVTVQLSLISMALGSVLALLIALGRMSPRRLVRGALGAYVEMCRNIPLVVQLMAIYFALPQVGVSLPGFWAGVLGLSLNLAAYLAEVFRAAIQSVDVGQEEAGLSMGMSRLKVFWRIVLPQAMRMALPSVGGYFVSLLKDSSLVSFIAVNELLRHGSIVIAETFLSMRVYLIVALIYFMMSFIAARIIRWMEWYFAPGHRVEDTHVGGTETVPAGSAGEGEK